MVKKDLLISFPRPNVEEDPKSTTHRLANSRVGVRKALSDALVKIVEATRVFHSALVASLSGDNGFDPARGMKAQLGVPVLGGTSDVLQDTSGKGHMSDNSIDGYVAVLSAYFLHSTAEFDEILHHYLNHRIDSGTTGLGKILDHETTGDAESSSKRIDDLEDAIKEVLHGTNKLSGEGLRSVAADKTSEGDHVALTSNPVFFGFSAVEARKHVTYHVIDIAGRRNNEWFNVLRVIAWNVPVFR